MLLEPEELSAIVGRVVRSVTDPLLVRIAALEAARGVATWDISGQPDPVPGPPGPAGKDADPTAIVDLLAKTFKPPRDGKDADPELMASMVTRAVAEAMAALPVPKDGANGADGTSVTVDDVAPLIAEEVTKAIAAIPPAKDGAGGTNGQDGTSVTVEDVLPLLAEHVTKAVASLPAPKDGTSVTPADVAPMIAAEVQKAVAAIPPAKDGKDGVGVVGTLLDRAGHLILTLSDGGTKDVGLVVGNDVDPVEVRRQITETLAAWPRPKDGVDGKDGLGFDNLDLVFDDTKGYLLRFSRGDQVTDFPVAIPVDCGVYKADRTYWKGAGVTWAGSFWIAQSDTSEKPGDGATSWRLSVKRGGDGKQGPTGEKGLDGKAGRDGKDGQWR